MEIEWKVFNKSQSNPIGTVSSVLYVLNLFETSGTASCGTTGIDPEQTVENTENAKTMSIVLPGVKLCYRCGNLGADPGFFGNVVLIRSSFNQERSKEGSIPQKRNDDAKRCAEHQYTYAAYIYSM